MTIKILAYYYTTAPESWAGTNVIVLAPGGREYEAYALSRLITPPNHPSLYTTAELTEAQLNSATGDLNKTYLLDLATLELCLIRKGVRIPLDYENLEGPYTVKK